MTNAAVFVSLVELCERLRAPAGCPWDREQTLESLRAYIIEEAYEVIDAISAGDQEQLAGELGDLLFQIVLVAQLARERGWFDIADVCEKIHAKMVRRHPHVFGTASVPTAQAALAQWEAIKQREGERAGNRRSVIDGVPRALPALIRAQRVQTKAARVNFDWPDAPSAWHKVEEEVREATEALQAGDSGRFREELGDLLFSLVNVARLSSIDAEDALHGAVEKFRRRFTDMEAALTAEGTSVSTVGQEELERSWQAAKTRERQG